MDCRVIATSRTGAIPTTPYKIPSDDFDLGKVLDFMRVLWDLDHELKSASKRMHSTLGMTGPQRLTLRVVSKYPGISAGDLSRVLHLHPSTLTGVLGRLVSARLLERRVDLVDARKAVFLVTPHGAKAAARPSGTVEAAVRSGLEATGANKVASTIHLLGVLAEELRRLARNVASKSA